MMENIPGYDAWKTAPTDEEEEDEQERRFKVRKRHYNNYCDYMEEIINGNIISD
ncbi:hypothetical protein [Faecalicatena contorta]|uniref:Uncharacterized protein n=1 Tax=Faecalicatena contorta TaxID=39482 RepID=A0A315ZVH9_9FIRM|nr:hypothetical protein [Faecalicatena contorta]PWJ49319.1 hypothetical protein A8805_10715 [Faecalicatena contorta]SUQ14563.1 hypothetical protein SAMN05216529_10715 [Faecalicatena contorta]